MKNVKLAVVAVGAVMTMFLVGCSQAEEEPVENATGNSAMESAPAIGTDSMSGGSAPQTGAGSGPAAPPLGPATMGNPKKSK